MDPHTSSNTIVVMTPDETMLTRRRDHALACRLALNGLRISEALGADIDDLDQNRGHRTLFIHRKGGKTATIPLAPRTARALDLYVEERTSGPIFMNHDMTRRLDRHAATRIVKRLATAAGIDKKISPHSLRHSFITAALDAGVPLRDVQEAASHADPRRTMDVGLVVEITGRGHDRVFRCDRVLQILER